MDKTTLEDMQLEVPRSIRDVIVDEIHAANYTEFEKTGNAQRLDDDAVEKLLKRIYAHVEKEALKVFKSSEPWALKAWAYAHILKDETAKQAAIEDPTLLDELVAPVKDWQAADFDPVANLKESLEAGQYAPQYISACVHVAREVVLRYGKKQTYTEPELRDYLAHLRKRYAPSSYVVRVHELKVFVDSLPLDERGQKPKLPIRRLPAYPKSGFHRPIFTQEELESIAAAALIDEDPQTIARILISQVYGVRLGELATVSSEYINLNHGSPSITFLVEKKRGGEREPLTQPIPQELAPFLQITIEPREPHSLLRDLKRVCKKAGVKLPPRAGYHAIRRAVVTALWQLPEVKELAIRRFLRWSTSNLGVLPNYVQATPEQTAVEVLKVHPFASWWKDWAKLLPLPQYAPSSVHMLMV